MSFQVGDCVVYRRFPDSEERDGVILAVEDHRAYVHFKWCDKRLDVWAQFEDLRKLTDIIKRRRYDTEYDAISKVPDVRNIETITIGNYLISAWYFSPYDESFVKARHLYVCDCCRMYVGTEREDCNHNHTIQSRRPQCAEIYRDGSLSLFEASPTTHKFFCQCVCLLGKLFLNETAVCYDVNPYLFYVLCECDDLGAHVVGFFWRTGKWSDFNICSSLVVLPPFQNKGYGSLLIKIAYHIAKLKGTYGGPERPLNDMGKVAFESYWRKAIVNCVVENGASSISEIVRETGIAENDVVRTLTHHDFLFLPAKELNFEAIEKYANEAKDKLKLKIDFREENCLCLAQK